MKLAHSVLFGLTAFFALVTWALAASNLAQWNGANNPEDATIRDRTRLSLFSGLLTMLVYGALMAGFLLASGSKLVGLLPHLVGTVVCVRLRDIRRT